jgi:hypothetical protein
MDSFIESEELTDVFDRWLDEQDITESEAASLAQCFEIVLEECEFEFGD